MRLATRCESRNVAKQTRWMQRHVAERYTTPDLDDKELTTLDQ